MNVHLNNREIDRFVSEFIETKKRMIVDELLKKYLNQIEAELKLRILEEASKVQIALVKNANMTTDLILSFEIKEGKNNPKE